VARQRKIAVRDPADTLADLEQAKAELHKYGLDV
jgi:hypothetical protein